MSGFVAPPPSGPSSPDPEDLVDGGTFYPQLEISRFRDSMRVSTSVADVRVRDALRAGMLTVRVDLQAWAAAKIAAGYPALEAIDCDEIDLEPITVILWRRAVFSYAAAELVETHNEISATKDGTDRVEQLTPTAADHRRNGLHAVRDLLGVGRTAVELI